MTSRRALLRMTGACCLAGAALTAPRVLLAAAPMSERFVTVILRGAMDGLGAVAPTPTPTIGRSAGGLALAEPGTEAGLLDLDGRFGLHPSLSTLHGWFSSRELLVVHAVATPYRERSHFDGQDLLENGTTSPQGRRDGWLNRALGLMGADGNRIGLAVGQTVPLTLRGSTAVASWAPGGLPDPDEDFLARLQALYAADAELGPVFHEAMTTREMIDGVLGDDMARMARLEALEMCTMARDAGRLLAAPEGARVAVMELNGWDTHVGQGAAEGRLARQLLTLDKALASLREGLDEAWGQTAVVVVTEFGRTVPENGTGGTDHGTATIAMLAGGGVEGGRVVGRWPGLAAAKLYQGRDLAPTTDLRSLLKTVLVDHLRLPTDGVERLVFPGSAGVASLREIVRV